MFQHIFYAFFTASKVGKFGITVTCSVFRGTGSLVVSDQPATEMGKGLFRYIFNSAEEDDYLAIFATADATVDMKEIPSMVSKIISSIDAPISSITTEILDNLWEKDLVDLITPGTIGNLLAKNIDTTISSRSHHNVQDIWDNWTGDMTTAESIGKFLVENVGGGTSITPADIWAEPSESLIVDGSIGELLVSNVDAPVSSRSSHSPIDIWNVASSAFSVVGSIGKYILSMITQISDIITAEVSIFTPLNPESEQIEIVAGDDYSASDNRSFDWNLVGWPSLTGASISFVAGPLIVAGTVVSSTLARVELTKAQTITLEKREYEYRVSATTLNSRKITFSRGILVVK